MSTPLLIEMINISYVYVYSSSSPKRKEDALDHLTYAILYAEYFCKKMVTLARTQLTVYHFSGEAINRHLSGSQGSCIQDIQDLQHYL